MKRAAVIVCVGLLDGCTGVVDDSEHAGPAGGVSTVQLRTTTAYQNPIALMTPEQDALHRDGDGTFDQVFVTAPAVVGAGLGPTFNNTACSGCHVGNGRGLPLLSSPGRHAHALVRVSVLDGRPEARGGSVAVPGFGLQLQDDAVFGVNPEVRVTLRWVTEVVTLADGTGVELRRPELEIEPLNGSEIPSDMLTSLRVAPAVFGLGLLEAVPAEQIAALADPDDADADGISGRVNAVWDRRSEQFVAGRFGLKANTADLELQAADAYFNDMGITSRLHPNNGTPEVSDADLEATIFYTRTLAVPDRDPNAVGEVERGERLFASVGCADCHTPELQTGASPLAGLAHQTIGPYSDLLLHDMGEGLADGRPDFEADGREWRTPPLWGIGLAQLVLPGVGYLHDGRARTLEEAILWHGGEAEASRDGWARLGVDDRTALIDFLRSL